MSTLTQHAVMCKLRGHLLAIDVGNVEDSVCWSEPKQGGGPSPSSIDAPCGNESTQAAVVLGLIDAL